MEKEISFVSFSKNTILRLLKISRMDDLVESIKQNGVLTPVLVRPDKNNSYEMISGHRRMHAAIKAGLETIPAIVRDMDDDDAVVVMVDANIQREELLPSEKAFAYKNLLFYFIMISLFLLLSCIRTSFHFTSYI